MWLLAPEEATLAGRLTQALADLLPEPALAQVVQRLLRVLVRSEQSSTRGGLRVAADARWFQWDGGPRVYLGHRRTACLILRALVQGHLQGRERLLSLEELREAGWPGERIPETAARNRLHVALAYLRKIGLREALVRRGDGYLLAPTVALRVEPLQERKGAVETS